jgi:tetratricopeptide (TPR) repeat protein
MRPPVSRASRQDRGGRWGRWRPHFAVIAILLLSAQLALVPAWAQVSLLDDARAHMAAGDPQAAYDLLVPYESSLAGDPGFDYLLGIAAMDSGHLTHSVFALERVLAVEPDNALARAEIARVYLMLGEVRTSQQEFETVNRRDDLPPAARNTVEQYLTAFRATPEEGADFKAFLAVTLGWDSNVNAATSTSSVAIPGTGGAIFVLDPTATDVEDTFATVAAGASVSAPINDSLRFNAGLNAYSKFLSEQTEFQTQSLNGFAGLDLSHGDTVYTVAAQGERFFLDRDTYRNALGGLLQFRHAVSDVNQFTGYAQYARLLYPEQSFRDGNRFTLGGAYSSILPGRFAPTGFIGGFGGVEDPDDSAFDYLKYGFFGVRMGGQLRFNQQTSLFGFFNYERRYYDTTDPLWQVRREDNHYGVRFGSDYAFASQWTLTPAVDYIRSDSNVEVFTYDRWILSATVRVDFD